MRPSGTVYLTCVIAYSLLGIGFSCVGAYITALFSFVIAGGAIAYYDQALATARALDLAEECLALWKKAVGKELVA